LTKRRTSWLIRDISASRGIGEWGYNYTGHFAGRRFGSVKFTNGLSDGRTVLQGRVRQADS
jgi:hypothetical protein